MAQPTPVRNEFSETVSQSCDLEHLPEGSAKETLLALTRNPAPAQSFFPLEEFPEGPFKTALLEIIAGESPMRIKLGGGSVLYVVGPQDYDRSQYPRQVSNWPYLVLTEVSKRPGEPKAALCVLLPDDYARIAAVKQREAWIFAGASVAATFE